MKVLDVMFGIIFILAAVVFLSTGAKLEPRTSIHEIYQMMWYICSILCFGFGFLLCKETK